MINIRIGPWSRFLYEGDIHAMGWFAKRRRLRDAVAAEQWRRFWDFALQNQLYILQIDHVYQFSRGGSKAIVRFYGSARQRDAWFWGCHVQTGYAVAVLAGEGFGPHSGRCDVLYIGSKERPGIFAALGKETLAAASRHYALTSGNSFIAW